MGKREGNLREVLRRAWLPPCVRYTEVCHPGLGFVGVNSRALRAYTVPHSLVLIRVIRDPKNLKKSIDTLLGVQLQGAPSPGLCR